MGTGSSWVLVAPPCPLTHSCVVMALPRDAGTGASGHCQTCHSHTGSTSTSAVKEKGMSMFFSLNQKSVMLSSGGCGGTQCVVPEAVDSNALPSVARGSLHSSVPVSDDRARSFLAPSGSTSRILQQGRGRCCVPSVKELSALYLSQTAAAAAAAAADASPAQPVRTGSPPPPATSGIPAMSCPKCPCKVAVRG